MWAEDANDRRLPTIRQQNESLVRTAREVGLRESTPWVFLCECNDEFCTDYVKMTITEYEDWRRTRGAILCADHVPPRALNQPVA